MTNEPLQVDMNVGDQAKLDARPHGVIQWWLLAQARPGHDIVTGGPTGGEGRELRSYRAACSSATASRSGALPPRAFITPAQLAWPRGPTTPAASCSLWFSPTSPGSTLLLPAAAACLFFFSSRRRHTRCLSDWSSDVCSSD